MGMSPLYGTWALIDEPRYETQSIALQKGRGVCMTFQKKEKKEMHLSWPQICAIVYSFAIAQNGHVSIDEEKKQILIYAKDNVLFQLPKLAVLPARLNQGAWTVQLIRGYDLPSLIFTPTYSVQRFNSTLLDAWNHENKVEM
jgi:hypothetical protein